ncbi:MAG: HAD family hydrolase [Ruminococcus sp.]|nr:HAD family hydrolase [Ruminococcus sp.]
MNHKKLCIFDLDGTMVNSLADLAAAVNHGLSAMGYPEHPTDAYRMMVGNGARILCKRALPEGVSDSEIERLHSLFSEYYNAHSLEYTIPYEGICALLDKLLDAGCILAAATNKPQVFAEQIIHHFFGDRFSVIRGGCGKPAPDAVLDILSVTSCSAEQAVLLGDSNVDIFTAKHACIDAIACCWGFRSEQELREAGAEVLIHTPADAVKILCG